MWVRWQSKRSGNDGRRSSGVQWRLSIWHWVDDRKQVVTRCMRPINVAPTYHDMLDDAAKVCRRCRKEAGQGGG